MEVAPKVCNDRENCAAAMGATVEQPRRRQLSPDSVSGETIFGNISRPCRAKWKIVCTLSDETLPALSAVAAAGLWTSAIARTLMQGSLLKSCQANDRRQLASTKGAAKGGRSGATSKCHKLILSIK